MYYLIFFICIFSRILSSIYYIEDIDSLRFAFSVIEEYNVSKLQPHFPGYPIFCFITILFYQITGSLGFSFSIIGGISTFFIIYFSIKILNYYKSNIDSWFVFLILFFNPMIWLLGNRYMPDLMGLSIAVASIYYLNFGKTKTHSYIGFFLAGILPGVRLSFVPLLIAPCLWSYFNKKRKYFLFISFLSGLLIWFIPFIISQGYQNLFYIGIKHSMGHFNDYGGTIITENDFMLRLKFLINTVWSDGLGGYWIGRSWITLFVSLPLLILFIDRISIIKKIFKSKYKIIMYSFILYLLWIFLFQNMIYKSRHVLPLVFILLLFICYPVKGKKRFLIRLIFILSLLPITYNLIYMHKGGTAIYRLSEHFKLTTPKIIISNPLVNYYLDSNGIDADYINIEKINHGDIEGLVQKENIRVVGDYSNLINGTNKLLLDTVFYHNPYMNRMWSTIPTYLVGKNGN